MVEKMCRLCFEEKTPLIDLFAPKGVQLNAANVIRLHFPDEVKTNNIYHQQYIFECELQL